MIIKVFHQIIPMPTVNDIGWYILDNTIDKINVNNRFFYNVEHMHQYILPYMRKKPLLIMLTLIDIVML